MAIFYIDSGSFGNVSITSLTAPNYVLNSSTSSFITNTQTGVFLTTGSSGASQTINGSLTINQNLTVLGSSSILYVTSSQLNIGTNIITVNANAPAVRYGGLAVIDSGSSPQRSGSILFDSTNNQWIFVHQNAGGAVTSSVFIQGPQTFNNVGNETTLTVNRIPKATGGDLGEHIGDSNITDTGTIIQLGTNTQVTGSLDVSTNISAAGNITAQTNLVSAFSSGDEGGQILLAKSVTNNSLTGSGVNIDVYQNRLRFWEDGSPNRGGFLDITTLSNSVGTNLQKSSNYFYDAYLINAQTTAAGTDTTINNLTFTTSANQAWSFEASFVGQCSGTGGVRFTVVYSAVPVSSSVSYWGNSTQVGNMTSATTVLTTPAQSNTMWATATPIDVQANIRTSFVNGANANTVTIKIQPQNGAQTATLRAMSYLVARRIT